jgi:hypothetical protein
MLMGTVLSFIPLMKDISYAYGHIFVLHTLDEGHFPGLSA